MRWNRCYWVMFKLKRLMFYVTGIEVGYHGGSPRQAARTLRRQRGFGADLETGLAYRSMAASRVAFA